MSLTLDHIRETVVRRSGGHTWATPQSELAHYLADMVTHAVLMAHRAGVNLNDVIAERLNMPKPCEQCGSRETITTVAPDQTYSGTCKGCGQTRFILGNLDASPVVPPVADDLHGVSIDLETIAAGRDLVTGDWLRVEHMRTIAASSLKTVKRLLRQKPEAAEEFEVLRKLINEWHSLAFDISPVPASTAADLAKLVSDFIVPLRELRAAHTQVFGAGLTVADPRAIYTAAVARLKKSAMEGERGHQQSDRLTAAIHAAADAAGLVGHQTTVTDDDTVGWLESLGEDAAGFKSLRHSINGWYMQLYGQDRPCGDNCDELTTRIGAFVTPLLQLKEAHDRVCGSYVPGANPLAFYTTLVERLEQRATSAEQNHQHHHCRRVDQLSAAIAQLYSDLQCVPCAGLPDPYADAVSRISAIRIQVRSIGTVNDIKHRQKLVYDAIFAAHREVFGYITPVMAPHQMEPALLGIIKQLADKAKVGAQ